ncbi:MAG: type II toxin-antitoxin system HicA family toxin [Cyanobacteria bacterium P01_G01_bin.54]
MCLKSRSYKKIITALEWDGWRVVRQKGSHIRLEKTLPQETLKITVPVHKPVKRSTLAKTLKQVKIDVDQFLELL